MKPSNFANEIDVINHVKGLIAAQFSHGSLDIYSASDVVQSAFIRLIQSETPVKTLDELAARLYTIAKFRAMTLTKRSKRPLDRTQADTPGTNNWSPEHEAVLKELLEKHHSILSSIPEKSREMIFMKLEGRALLEISRLLSVSEYTVKRTYRKYCEQVQELANEMPTPEE
jgi:RNA polymerase sigma factor (sigma-70 family)